MRLLIVTQSVDENNPILGFFVRWIEEFAKKFESIIVICLEKGAFDLPQNVKVLSLGKEAGRSRLKYLWNFYRYIWRERKNYDAVFVHMNQEYVLLGAKHWWLMRKPVYLWRNHQSGNILTDIAALFCRKVFCTSKYSYTAKYEKTVIMPVGVDTALFKPGGATRVPHSILALGRIAPVKRLELLVEALNAINDTEYTADIVGEPAPKDVAYYESLKRMAAGNRRISFLSAVAHGMTPELYASHEIFVNLSPSGLFDKTIFEAMASGCLVLASNENLRGQISDIFIFKTDDKDELKDKLSSLILCSSEQKEIMRKELKTFSDKHDINNLAEKVYLVINND